MKRENRLCDYFIVSKIRPISSGGVEFIGPSMDDRMTVELVDGDDDARSLSCCFGATGCGAGRSGQA
jgi:hypothetical protein